MKHQHTTPRPPDAWLVLKNYGSGSVKTCDKVVGAFPSQSDASLVRMVRAENRLLAGSARVALDHPSLKVTHYGIGIINPCWLAARDNWFDRYADILDSRLVDPRFAQVFTFEPGTLADPLASHKSSRRGPFAFPRGNPWPRCRFCQNQLAFLGTLDFRDYDAVSVPKGSLVVHVCAKCGVGSDPETWATTWIKENEPVEIMGDRDKQVLVGKRWLATEYPIPATYAEELVTEGSFLEEHSIYMNFSCFADKIGGHAYRIQGHYGDIVPDSNGVPMVYIGQLLDSPGIQIGDCGVAYLYYSPSTGETVMYPESS